MFRKSKVDPAIKVKLVERYLRNEIGMSEAARLAGIASRKSFGAWVRIYRNEGPYGLLDQKHNKSYSTELMLAAVTAYHTIRTRESAMLVKGTKQKWVLKSCITGDTISLDKCKFYVEEYDEGALKLGKKATTTAKYNNGLWATPEARIYVIYGDKYYWCDVYIYDTAEDAWEADTTMP